MVQSVQQREVEDRVREKEEIIETLESKIADLQEQVQALFNDLQKSGALSTANNEQVLKLKQELEASEQRQLDDKQRIEEKYQAEAEVLKQQISNLKDRNLYLETNLEKSNTKCAAMEQRVKMMERESNPVSLPLG
jgi:chromosome segregation ATPase